jgi:hypothetical protein
MKLIEAKVAGQPRIVSTRRGDRSVMDCRTADGQSLTVWRPAGDVELMARANGERVTLAQDSKGKVSLVETARSRADREWQRSTDLTKDLDTELGLTDHRSHRTAEIADYIERLGKLYNYCHGVASRQLAHTEMDTPQIKDVSTTLFIQTVRHFSL